MRLSLLDFVSRSLVHTREEEKMRLGLLDFVSLSLALKPHDGPTVLSDDRRKLTFFTG